MHTPWGASDHTERAGLRGVLLVGTPSHGGYMVTNRVGEERLSPEARAIGKSSYGYIDSHYCFEEDCAYAVLHWEIPEVREFSRQSQLRYLPDTEYRRQIATPEGHTTLLGMVLRSVYPDYAKAHPDPRQ